jgi:hypothetical protein
LASIGKQLLPQLSVLTPAIADAGPTATAASEQCQLLASTSSYQLQQQRGAAAKKKTQAGKAVKKGQQPAGKKQKQKMETKPFDEKDPLMQKLVAMLVPAAEPVPRTHQQQRAAAAAAFQYRRQQNLRHMAWSADMRKKLALKAAALKALPPDLRAAAAEEDLTPFPLTRHFLYDTPPESYRQ